MLKVLDLFSGIGGFSLGLERTGGFETVAFCEIDPFCRRVLAKHWPKVPIYDDVRTLTGERLKADGVSVDVICGGFPCQDISTAGPGVGIAGGRSGLWSEYARIIGELRPLYVVVENVAALLSRGLDRVLGDLSSLGLDAEWHCIPASAVGAPHRRDRVWIVAYPSANLRRQNTGGMGACEGAESCQTQSRGIWKGNRRARYDGFAARGENVSYAYGNGLAWGAQCDFWSERRVDSSRGNNALRPYSRRTRANGWASEPDVGRVAHGVPDRTHRLKALGNAVVPQIPELIGNAILASLKQAEAA